MRTRAEWKQAAKEQLGKEIFGNFWMTALGVTALFSLIVAAIGAILQGIGSLIVTGPLSVGIAYLFAKQARDKQNMKFGDLFRFFSVDFGGTFLLGLMKTIFITLWSLLFVFPGWIKTYAYGMADFIKADHPEYGWKQCIDESKRITEGHKWELFVLDLSFIGWYIVGALCLGVGTLWVIPYHFAAKAQAYLDLSGKSACSETSFVDFN